jgi:hypothetical protein
MADEVKDAWKLVGDLMRHGYTGAEIVKMFHHTPIQFMDGKRAIVVTADEVRQLHRRVKPNFRRVTRRA